MGISHSEFLTMCARLNRNKLREAVPADAAESESDLQDQIESECNRRGWVCVRTRMDRATTFTTPGVPDFLILADSKRVFCVECKSRTGKQSPEQRGFQMRVERLGHVYALVRSFSEFLAMISSMSGRLVHNAPGERLEASKI